jgi:hypothetical protein
MQIVVLLAFVVGLTALDMPLEFPSPLPGNWSVAAIGAYLLVSAALSAAGAIPAARALRRRGQMTVRATRLHGLVTAAGNAWLVVGLAGVISAGYGRWLREHLGLRHVPLAAELAALAPFVAALLINWVLEYPLHRARRERLFGSALFATPPRVWRLGEYLGYNVRHHLLFIAAPLCLILLARDLLDQNLAPRLKDSPGGQAILFGAMFCSAGLVFFFAPVLIVRLWKTRALPAGSLRVELEDLCRRMKLRYREILLWESGGVIANAGVMGLAPSVRYILLSDALLDNMDRRCVLSVFAHEAGHIVCRHILYSMMFAIASVTLCVYAVALLGEGVELSQPMGEMIALPLLAVVWGSGFGWISRRFEWQSDAIAAWASGQAPPSPDGVISQEGAAVFAIALGRVAQLSGIPYRQRNWRHGSIEHRIERVLMLGQTGGTRREIDRVVNRVKVLLWLGLIASVAVTVWDLTREWFNG